MSDSTYPSTNYTGKTLNNVYNNFAQYTASIDGTIDTFVDGLGTSSLDLKIFYFPLSKTSSYCSNYITASISSTSSVSNALLGVKNSLFKKGDITVPIFSIVNETGSLMTNSSLMVYINYNTVVNFPISTSIVMPTLLLAGNDFGVYATYDNQLIACSCSYSGYLIPVGYDNTNSKLIGGFYYAHSGSSTITTISRSRENNISYITASASHGLISGDYVDVTLMGSTTYNNIDTPITVSGDIISYANGGSNESPIKDIAGRLWKINNNGIINQYSLWDLKFRPGCSDPRGMVLVDNKFWMDIWNGGVNYNTSGSSHKGDVIADGSLPPVRSPSMGGNGTTKYTTLTWFEATEVASYVGKRLPTYDEYSIAGYGATEAASFGIDPVINCRCIGYTSKWGCEAMNGVMRVWGRDLSFRYDPQTSVSSTYRSRTSNIATITSSAHNLAVGDVVTLTSFGGTGYNKGQTIIVSVPSTTTFTYNSSGTDEVITADTAGIIGIGIPTFNYVNQAGGRGQLYIQGPSGLVAGLYGGGWNYGTNAGSRNSYWYYAVWYSIYNIGFRSCFDHIVVP